MPGLDTVVVMVLDIPVVLDIMVVVVIMEVDMELGGTVAVMVMGMACMVVEDMVAVTLAACMVVEAMGALLPAGITTVVLGWGVWDPGIQQGTQMLQHHHLPGKRC